ncbi:MAG: PD40 domain-containing protein [Candidatus Aminicenantes bacterium]|nr:MAG: PD40 domain-containing protein [Candidatus Aminicenantes bacterium]
MRIGRKVLIPFLLTASCLLFVLGNVPLQESAEEAFEKAVYFEDVQGDLHKAIGLYEQILKQFPENRQIAANAQLHIGLCYEKLGKTEAIKAYELVLENYADQAGQVAAARERLGALKREEPSGPYKTKIFDGDLSVWVQDISPDGTKLALAPIEDKRINIAIYDLSTKQMDYVTHYGWEKQVRFAKWSPDGNKIVFHQSGLDPAGPAEIAVSTLEGKTRVLYRVENKKEGYPVPYAWLPDGSAILTGIFKTGTGGGTLGFIPVSGGSFKGLHSLKDNAQMSHETADVSPDGRFVVFQDKNPKGKYDLYIIGTDGSSLEVLSDHPADEGLPRWSPDGKHIVFGSSRHGRPALWGIGVRGGKPVGEPFFIKEGLSLFPQSLLNWTKQGLACKEYIRVQDIYIVSIDPDSFKITGKPRQIEYTPTGGNVCPSWSPNGKELAFVAINPVTIQVTGENKIVVAPVNGGEPQEFLSAAKYIAALAIHDLRWLPDGSGFSLSDYRPEMESALHQLDLKTGEWKKWAIPIQSWTQTERSADGKSFFYARHGFRHDQPGIIERNLETGAERYVYKPEGERGSVFRQLKCSRDYTKLVFTEDNARIKLVDLKTGEQRDVSSEYHGALAWSPDAKHLITTGDNNKLGFPTAMYILNVDDGSAKKLDLGFPEGKTFFSPTWSPDGKNIAFMVQSQNHELVLMKNIIPKNK